MGWPHLREPPHIPSPPHISPPLPIPPEKTNTHATKQPKPQPQPNTKPSTSLQKQPSNLPLPHSKPQFLTRDLTKQPNTIHIDNKFFQFSLGGGRAYPYSITERKFKTTLGKIWLSLHDMVWLGNTIDKAAKVDMGGEFFRNHRDGYKAIHVLRRSNQHGLYLEVSEFHSGSQKGVIRIPAGLEQQGWFQFACMCKDYRNMQNPAKLPMKELTNDRRRVAAGGAVPNKEVEGAKPQILQNQNHVTAAVKKAVNLISIDSPSDTVNARVLLSLNLELSCGPDGNWAISKADLKQSEQMRPDPSRMPPNVIGSTSRPDKTKNKVWRPKAQTTQYVSQTRDPKNSIPEVSSRVEDPCGMETHFTAPTQDVASTSALTESSDGDEECVCDDVTISSCSEIGEPSDATWTLQLRDGQRLFMPQMPPLPLSPNPFYALSSSELGVEIMDKLEQPEVWPIDNLALTKAMDAPEQASAIFSGDVGDWGGQAKWVEPLAVEYPAIEPPGVPEAQDSSCRDGNFAPTRPNPPRTAPPRTARIVPAP
jgi:hypothetical protein